MKKSKKRKRNAQKVKVKVVNPIYDFALTRPFVDGCFYPITTFKDRQLFCSELSLFKVKVQIIYDETIRFASSAHHEYIPFQIQINWNEKTSRENEQEFIYKEKESVIFSQKVQTEQTHFWSLVNQTELISEQQIIPSLTKFLLPSCQILNIKNEKNQLWLAPVYSDCSFDLHSTDLKHQTKNDLYLIAYIIIDMEKEFHKTVLKEFLPNDLISIVISFVIESVPSKLYIPSTAISKRKKMRS